MRYLGIDYGTKKTGLALSDEAGTMGFPHEVVPTARLSVVLGELIPRRAVGAIVIGEPTDLSGADNPIAEEVRHFAAMLEARYGLPIYWESEVYTSAEARRAPGKAPKTRTQKARSPADASAAALILTSFLSHHG